MDSQLHCVWVCEMWEVQSGAVKLISDVIGCTWVTCIQVHQRTNFTAPGCTSLLCARLAFVCIEIERIRELKERVWVAWFQVGNSTSCLKGSCSRRFFSGSIQALLLDQGALNLQWAKNHACMELCQFWKYIYVQCDSVRKVLSWLSRGMKFSVVCAKVCAQTNQTGVFSGVKLCKIESFIWVLLCAFEVWVIFWTQVVPDPRRPQADIGFVDHGQRSLVGRFLSCFGLTIEALCPHSHCSLPLFPEIRSGLVSQLVSYVVVWSVCHQIVSPMIIKTSTELYPRSKSEEVLFFPERKIEFVKEKCPNLVIILKECEGLPWSTAADAREALVWCPTRCKGSRFA